MTFLSIEGGKSPKRGAWEGGLIRAQESGAVKKVAANVVLILSKAPEWEGAISWDEFAERIVIVRVCPAGEPGPWSDLADVQTAVWLQRSRYRLEASPDLVATSIRAVAAAKSVHPLRKRLDGLKWDGTVRLDTWTTKYLGAADTEVHREMGKRWMLGAVSRAFVPGSQVDTALILEGHQGLGKSTAVRILSLGFFTDELADIGSKDAAMQLHGAWIVELPELDAMGRAETSRVKAFLTRRSDRYRAPYGRHVAEHPRQCTFAGTVNHNDYLRDETGGRRFLPIEVTRIDAVALKADVEQLWAEAVVRFRAGEETFTSNERLRTLIAEHTATRYQADAWHDHVKTYAQLYESTSIAECLSHVGVPREKWSQSDSLRISKILKSEGFARRQVRTGLTREWRYFKPLKPVTTSPSNETGADASARNQAVVTMSPVVTNENVNVNTEALGDFKEPGVTPVPAGDLVTDQTPSFGEWLEEQGIGDADD